MPDLFVKCLTCDGVGIILNEEEAEWLDCPDFCERGFIRYGTEAEHQHEWKATIIRGRHGYWKNVGLFTRITDSQVSCACGKSAVGTA